MYASGSISAVGGDRWYKNPDPTGYAFILANLTTDGTWRDLDFSSKVPVGTKVIRLRVSVRDDATGSIIQFRKKGDTNEVNVGLARAFILDMDLNHYFELALDENRVAQYNATNTTWTGIYITVRSWFI